MSTELTWIDIGVIGTYFALVLSTGLLSLLQRDSRQGISGYFLAGRSMHWLPIGCSLFASNIGAEHFIGLAGTGASSGIAVILYEWFCIVLVILLAWLFLPVFVASGVFTLPEYLEKRYKSPVLRIYISSVCILLYIVTKIAVCIYAGGLFISMAVKIDVYLAMCALLGITLIYTVIGGLAAVIYTDTIQTFIMLIGAFALTIIGFNEVGGYESFQQRYANSTASYNSTQTTTMAMPTRVAAVTTKQASASYDQCGKPHALAMNLIRPLSDPEFPWLGLVLQSSLGCLWYWCSDMVIVQRSLAARSLLHAKGGSLLAGLLKFLPLWLIIFPGMISRALYPNEIACNRPEVCEQLCQNRAGCSNMAYPFLVLKLLPTGLRGLQVAVMLSAITSSLTSIFNSASSIFTCDIWTFIRKKWKSGLSRSDSNIPPTITEAELLIVGRVTVIVLCGLAIAWIPILKSSHGGQLFLYIQAFQSYLGTPIGALFSMSIFSKRITMPGALAGILVGHAIGIVRLVMDVLYPSPVCGDQDLRPWWVSQVVQKYMHYSYFGAMSIAATVLVAYTVSLFTKAMDEDELKKLVFRRNFVETEASDELNAERSGQHLTPQVTVDNSMLVSDTFGSCTSKRWIRVLCCLFKSRAANQQHKNKLGDVELPGEHVTGSKIAIKHLAPTGEEQMKGFFEESKRASFNVNCAAAGLLFILVFLLMYYR